MKKLLYPFVCLLLIYQVSSAQDYNEVSLNFKNDAIFNEDQDYTGGLELSYRNLNSDLTYYFGQDTYTPKDKRAIAPLAGEHPYGAWLYLGVSKEIEYSDNITNDIKFTVGTIGDNAKGESITNGIHKIIGASEENGWNTQVDQSFSYNINLKSSYSLISSYDSYTVKPYIVANIGNIFTDIGVGISAASPINDVVKLYSSVEVKYVDENIFLDGEDKDGSTRYAVEKLNQKDIFTLGVETTYVEDYTISVEAILNSKEYKTQSTNNNYTMLKIVKRF